MDREEAQPVTETRSKRDRERKSIYCHIKAELAMYSAKKMLDEHT
jgi:hypothetical protein